MEKTFVKVTAVLDAGGQIRPAMLTWSDGNEADIDEVIDVCSNVLSREGRECMRYTCEICGKLEYLFCEAGRWFVER